MPSMSAARLWTWFTPATCLFTGRFEAQIKLEIFNLGRTLIPLIKRLDVHGTNILVSFAEQFGHDVAADESPRPPLKFDFA